MAKLHRRLALAILPLSVAISATVAQDTFRPSVKFCNRTLAPAKVAISFDLAGSSNSTSVGWYDVKGCTCRTILQNTSLKATEIFLHADRGGASGNLLNPAKGFACVKDSAFRLSGENANARACSASGGRWVPFKWYDTVGRPYTINLRQPGQCNLMGDQ